MKRYIAISTFNAFFNLIFWGFFIYQSFDGSYLSYFASFVIMSMTLYPVYRWYISLSNNVIINAHLSLFDGFTKIISLLSAIFIFIIAYYREDGKNIVDDKLIVLVAFILFFCSMARFFHFIFIFDKKANLANKLDIIHKNKGQDYSTFGSSLFNFDILKDYIQNYTNSDFYIIPDKLPKDENGIQFKIYSNNKTLFFNYIEKSFIFDGFMLKSDDIQDFQKEYDKKLFEMSDQELDTLRMWSI